MYFLFIKSKLKKLKTYEMYVMYGNSKDEGQHFGKPDHHISQCWQEVQQDQVNESQLNGGNGRR